MKPVDILRQRLHNQPLEGSHLSGPREVVRWHWWRKSQGQSKILLESITLIRKMAKENPMWGAEWIRGELFKLGIKVSNPSIQK
ncbi:MAG: hypothetical protein WCA79_01315 [Anaerolineales bacterium]